MGFSTKLQYFLVKRLGISNKEVQQFLMDKKVKINGNVVSSNPEVEPEDEIVVDGKIVQAAKTFKYLAYYKPRGVETTLNSEIPDNLINILPFPDVFPVGRLDKASEGLLILTDDGRYYDKILRKENKTEKEYLVRVDKSITEEFIENMSSGIKIMGKMTLPCEVMWVSDMEFRIVLIQGLNRQIRRMCYKLGYEVLFLQRIRIGNVFLDKLEPGMWQEISKTDLN
ncbi:MAG: pseudouridine synthase [Cytophagaceae bacterium]|nr:pseudouridine synthase [Cytophagaceae bacterium]MBK9936284.1 pseudouridine synthase [Cytophagaceae bacterium]MBL0303822.1 pseudouridine synthase [Cytophagaceae bacterium]MBL0326638.1 pseudouridine synthase [Cytophagaceae bacterium]